MAVAYIGFPSLLPPRTERRRRRSKRPVTLPPTGEYLTRVQAGLFLGYPEDRAEDSVRGLVRHGHLKLGVHFVRPTERRLRFKRSALERFLNTPHREKQATMTDDELREYLADTARQLTGGKR